MATVATTTIADALGPPGVGPITRRYVDVNLDYLYTVVRTATDTLSVYVSTTNGASWGFMTSFTHVGLQEWSTLIYDNGGYLSLAYRVGTGTADTLWYRRYSLLNGSWSGGLQVTNTDANAGSIGSRWQGVDLAVVKNSNGSYAIVIAGAYADTTPKVGVIAVGVTIATNGSISLTNGIITGNRFWTFPGTSPGRSGITVEAEHNGDGITSTTPNVWITWGRTTLNLVKLTWVNSSTGWSGPSGYVVIRNPLATSLDYVSGRWDGTQYLMAVPSPDDTTRVRVYQRNKANTSTTAFDSPVHTTGTVRYMSVSYNNTTKDIRVYAVGTSTSVLYYVDYIRATGLWGSWTTVSASAILGSGTEWALRRGGTSGNAKFDVVYGVAGSPNTITHLAMSTSTAPAVSSFVTTGKPYTNGAAAAVGSALNLSWTFSDPDPGSSQGYYALSRQIGAGAVAYFNATTVTWGATEVQNTSVTQGVTLASGWGADGDSPHQYKVKVWDNAGIVSPAYSNPLSLYPSAVVNPTITSPTASQVLTTDTLTVTWTVAEQTGIRVVVAVAGGATVHDSGVKMGYTDTTYVVPVSLPTGVSYTVTVYAYNNDQLASAGIVQNFSVLYTPAPAAVSTVTAVPASGWMTVAATNRAAVGAQPAVLSQDLYRRVRAYSNAVVNGGFVGNTTGWSGLGGTLSYSTAQANSGAGSARVVPTGAAADSQVVSGQISIAALVAAGATSLVVSGWVRPDTALKSLRIVVNVYNAVPTLLGTVGLTVGPPVAAAWQYLEASVDISPYVATATQVTVGVGETGTPAAGDAFYVDDVALVGPSADTGIRVSAAVASGGSVNDFGPASGVDYEYRWVTKAANGTTQTGPWM